MKKASIAMLVLLIFLASCGGNSAVPDISEPNADATEAAIPITEANTDHEIGCGSNVFEKYRPRYYTLPVPFVDLVGIDEYHNWHSARSPEESDNECVAVSFVKYFDITQREFERANEELRGIWESVGASPEDGPSYETYPTELIFTFDNELINEYFLWENGPAYKY